VIDDGATLIEDLIIQAASIQSGIDVIPINLIDEIQRRRPDWPIVSVSQFIDELDALSFGTIRPLQSDAGGREFLIGPNGASHARQFIERRRPKSLAEKLSHWTRTDWIALGALIISALSLIVSIIALSRPDIPNAQTH
jgi:hypothetical protein